MKTFNLFGINVIIVLKRGVALGLFGNIFDPVKFAQHLIDNNAASNYAEPSGNIIFDKKISRLREECKAVKGSVFSPRIYILLKAGDAIKNPSSPMAFWYKIQCYISAGASGRPGVIEWIPKYLESDNYYLKSGTYVYGNKERLGFHIELLQKSLAESYSGEKMYSEALKEYADLHKHFPESEWYIIAVAKILNQINRATDAMDILVSKQKTKYYKTNFYKRSIDRAILMTSYAIVKQRDNQNYEWAKANLPDHCPKSFSGYRRMKNQRTKNFTALSNKCLEAGINLNPNDKYDKMAEEWNNLDQKEKYSIMW